MELCLSCVGGKTQCVFAGQCLVNVYAAANAMASQNKCGQSVVARVCWLLCASVIHYMGDGGGVVITEARPESTASIGRRCFPLKSSIAINTFQAHIPRNLNLKCFQSSKLLSFLFFEGE